jgi:hypothetical protein
VLLHVRHDAPPDGVGVIGALATERFLDVHVVKIELLDSIGTSSSTSGISGPLHRAP